LELAPLEPLRRERPASTAPDGAAGSPSCPQSLKRHLRQVLHIGERGVEAGGGLRELELAQAGRVDDDAAARQQDQLAVRRAPASSSSRVSPVSSARCRRSG
jgi:hypothetical protein